jgi:hypothetical protein
MCGRLACDLRDPESRLSESACGRETFNGEPGFIEEFRKCLQFVFAIEELVKNEDRARPQKWEHLPKNKYGRTVKIGVQVQNQTGMRSKRLHVIRQRIREPSLEQPDARVVKFRHDAIKIENLLADIQAPVLRQAFEAVESVEEGVRMFSNWVQ